MIWIENNQDFTIVAQLMHYNDIVAELTINFSAYTVGINHIKVINSEKLPFAVKNNFSSLFDWLLSRCLSMRNSRNIFFTRLLTTTETRNFRLPFVFSLSVNSVSLSDKYWLNPKSTTQFKCNGAEIIFERKTWKEVDPFQNIYTPGLLEQYGLNDIFCMEISEAINPRSLIWSTSGEQNKRWMIDGNGYFLEKKLMKTDFDNELDTFDFFSSNGALVPKYDCYIKELKHNNEEHNCKFRPDTISEGLHVIKKRCLTDSASHIVPLINYITIDTNIEVPIRRMFLDYNTFQEETERFIQLIKKYQEEFNVEDSLLDTRNMGLLITSNGAQPVVWGRLKTRRNLFGQIDE